MNWISVATLPPRWKLNPYNSGRLFVYNANPPEMSGPYRFGTGTYWFGNAKDDQPARDPHWSTDIGDPTHWAIPEPPRPERVCSNPACKARFTPGRSTQRFCGSEACARYAQRKRALAWWHRNKKARAEARKQKARKP